MSFHSDLLASLGPDPREILVVDIDRTISDGAHREALIGGGTSAEWDAFFEACDGDEPIDEIILAICAELRIRRNLARDGEPATTIVYLTGRPERVRVKTAEWLEPNMARSHEHHPHFLEMRADGDFTKAEIFKERVLKSLLDAGHKIVRVYDDERKTIDACVRLGICASYVVKAKPHRYRTVVASDVFARLEEALELKREFVAENAVTIEDIAERIRLACVCGPTRSKVVACGNGGSASDASHFVGELVGRFMAPGRPPIGALVLASDAATMTAIANDFGYAEVFERAARALCRKGDVFVGFSTSGMSANVIAAARVAKDAGACVIAFVGAKASPLAELADFIIHVDRGPDSARIQECHIFGVHLICERLEQLMGYGGARPAVALKMGTSPTK